MLANPKLYRGNKRKIVDRLLRAENGMCLELQVISSGGTMYDALEQLVRAGVVERFDHPTVKDRAGYPATAIRLKAEAE